MSGGRQAPPVPGDVVLGRVAARSLRVIDVVLAVWVAAWIAVGAWTGVEIHGLVGLADTVATAGRGLERSGDALSALGAVPVVGDQAAPLAESVRAAGAEASREGPAARRHIDRVAVLLALAVALVPSIPVLAVYLPARWARGRDVRALRGARRRDGDDGRLREFLARRALAHLPYEVLCGDGADPWADLAEGRHARLARLELAHLGLRALAWEGAR